MVCLSLYIYFLSTEKFRLISWLPDLTSGMRPGAPRRPLPPMRRFSQNRRELFRASLEYKMLPIIFTVEVKFQILAQDHIMV